jgi:hypothetical protein
METDLRRIGRSLGVIVLAAMAQPAVAATSSAPSPAEARPPRLELAPIAESNDVLTLRGQRIPIIAIAPQALLQRFAGRPNRASADPILDARTARDIDY